MSKSPRFWQRWFGGSPSEPKELAASAEPLVLGATEERWLTELASAIADGRRAGEVGDGLFFSHIDTLWRAGNEQLAIDWLRKFLSAPSVPTTIHSTLRARIVDLYEQRADLAAALPDLETLTGDPAHATRAHALLAEHYRRRGDDAKALRHYEAVLSRDVDYPNARARVDRLRQSQGRDLPAPGDTMAAGALHGVAAGTRYLLVRELGRGATGAVYLARDAELERDVAIKLLHPHLAGAGQATALAQFFREARTMASLRHPNIVAVLDLDERQRRIVMELASGGTLRDVLRERGPRSLRRALERHVQILSALTAAHRRGIVHRDLKPANLMFRRDADLPGVEVMLGDFGVAHLPTTKSEAAPEKTAVGTLAYMAPEQRRGGDVTPAADLYAAAIVLFEMITGRHPWSRDALLAGVRQKDDLRLPTDIVGDAPPELVREIEEHLIALADSHAAKRPTSSDALATAQRLRELAIGAEK